MNTSIYLVLQTSISNISLIGYILINKSKSYVNDNNNGNTLIGYTNSLTFPFFTSLTQIHCEMAQLFAIMNGKELN